MRKEKKPGGAGRTVLVAYRHDVAVRDLRQGQDNRLAYRRDDPVGLAVSEMEYLV